MNKIMPVVFVGHGSPMNAMQDNEFTRALNSFAKNIPKPKTVLCVSAHWVTDGTLITGSANPEQIYDFYGFPQELYNIRYKPKGSAALAKEVSKLLGDLKARVDPQRGIDHGTWSILRHMYPQCDIPVVQLSLDVERSAQEHYELSKILSGLREKGVLIVGSGNVVHNLSMIDWAQFAEITPPWAREFDGFVKGALDSGKDDQLINYAENNRHADYAVPTNEHYLPMLYVCGLRDKGEKVKYFYKGFQHGSISMRCFSLGI